MRVLRKVSLRVQLLDSNSHETIRYDAMIGLNAVPSSPHKRVVTVAPMPPEKLAYALARYSRSPDSIRDSIEWVRTHDSAKFLESFYFQYGHASIADLGHVTVCFEGVSEVAATEIEDEQLWDGQARSSRYQDFSTKGVIVPPELNANEARSYESAAEDLLTAYRNVQQQVLEYLQDQLPQPDGMKSRRNPPRWCAGRFFPGQWQPASPVQSAAEFPANAHQFFLWKCPAACAEALNTGASNTPP
jgi:hypothetical protein